MTEAAKTIASGLNGLMQQLDCVSHNVANAGTAGFKKRIVSFQQEYRKHLEAMEGKRSLKSNPIETSQAMDFAQGSLQETHRPLDVALDGRGFLTVQTPEGPLYTRNGCLRVNLLGQLVDLNGYILAGENGPIVLPPMAGESDLQIAADGTISAGEAQIGRLQLVDFGERQGQLVPAGMGVFRAPAGLNPAPAEGLSVRQGYQEQSNVQMVGELVNMMTLSRLYEANMNVMRRQRENSQAIMSVVNS